ncbi:TPA: hypothetical protein LWG50_002967, partial [Listeria monocytogenes]|nr:hypothetical protein [Listeria monocytogenes]
DIKDMSLTFTNSNYEEITEYEYDSNGCSRVYKLPLWKEYNIYLSSEDDDSEIIAEGINAFEISSYGIIDDSGDEYFFETSYPKGDIYYLNSLMGSQPPMSDGEVDE